MGLTDKSSCSADLQTCWPVDHDSSTSQLAVNLATAVMHDAAADGSSRVTGFRVTSALGSYPPGAKVLAGRKKHQYIIAPLGELVDESYTAYFNFTST